MHYLLKPLLRAMRRMNDRELKLSIILGLVLALAGLLYQFHPMVSYLGLFALSLLKGDGIYDSIGANWYKNPGEDCRRRPE
jgi:uncharacterized membrane protein HdeD (DUF308 family)